MLLQSWQSKLEHGPLLMVEPACLSIHCFNFDQDLHKRVGLVLKRQSRTSATFGVVLELHLAFLNAAHVRVRQRHIFLDILNQTPTLININHFLVEISQVISQAIMLRSEHPVPTGRKDAICLRHHVCVLAS